jgi:hypothetical protein
LRHLITLLAFLSLSCAPKAPPELAADDAAMLERRIAEREYRVSHNGRGLQAPNRAHALRTYFTPAGIEVHERGANQLLFRLQLAGFGRGAAALAAPGAGELEHDAARVEIRRPGLVEWYVNSPSGLEQGFTLDERPAGDGPLMLELTLAHARVSLHGEALSFISESGRRLEYGKLAAFDADGRLLPARFELATAQRVRVVVDDVGATYPLLIDPLLTATADARLDGDQQDAWLGTGVASAGDVNGDGYADVIVGAPLYDTGIPDVGAAFVFHGSAAGIGDGGPSSADTQLESDQVLSRFGVAVAGAGDVNGDGYDDVIVGARDYDAGNNNEGCAFVFLGGSDGVASASVASANARLESNRTHGSMGASVASAGDVNADGYGDVIVGAPGFNSNGAAYVFLGSPEGIGNGSSSTAAGRIESTQFGSDLGHSVAKAGDVNGDGHDDVLIGAPDYDVGSGHSGAVFVLHGDPTGLAGTFPQSIAARIDGNNSFQDLGASVTGAGDLNGDGYADVVIGDPRFSTAPGQMMGAAFVFLGSSDGLPDGVATIVADAQLHGDQDDADFGRAVAGAGDVNGDGYADVIVCAPGYYGEELDSNGYPQPIPAAGAAFVFLGSPDGIPDGDVTSAAHAIVASELGAAFGIAVAGAGDVNGDGHSDVVVGAWRQSDAATDAGAAFVYHGGAEGIHSGTPSNAATHIEADQVGAQLGASVASAGDVNGDGYGDVIVGAPNYDPEVPSFHGAAFIFHGGPNGVEADGSEAADTRLDGDAAHAGLGRRVASAGDVNGDGYGDVLVGGSTGSVGTVYLFHGSANGIASGGVATAATQIVKGVNGGLGELASAGDVNGDGYADILVGAPFYEPFPSQAGSAFVFHGGANGISSGTLSDADTRLQSTGTVFGESVRGAGDVNGDGFGDVIVGDWSYTNGDSFEGAAFVFLGSAAGIVGSNPATAAARIESDQVNAFLGRSVSGIGDVNGDGYDDVGIGVRNYETLASQFDEGALFVIHGGPAGIPSGGPGIAAAKIDGDHFDTFLGEPVAAAGDVNGDGYGDVIVGADGFDVGGVVRGAAFVLLGSATGVESGNVAQVAGAQISSTEDQFEFGKALAGAGDVNGDGFADVIAGAPYYDRPPYNGGGSAFVFLGNTLGRRVVARQQTATGQPIQPWGASRESDGFRVSLRANHPDGSGAVRGEFEACPAGSDFGDGACVHALQPEWTVVDPSTPDVTLAHSFSDLGDGVLYHWRARVQHAPLRVTHVGVTAPPNPAHGPWRRIQAQAVTADVRVIPEPGAAVGLAAGCALLSWLGARRRRMAG